MPRTRRIKIATFNINGVNGRLQLLLDWLERAKPDILCLQELKAPPARFPEEPLRAAGYEAVWHGQPRWNGVAILSRIGAPVLTRRGLPGDPDPAQSRYVEAAVGGILIACAYVPNGNPAPGPRFDYKLRWLDGFAAHLAGVIDMGVPAVIAGDFNIIPTEADVYDASRWTDDALFRPEVRAAFEDLLAQGWTDAIRKRHPRQPCFTFWDFMRNAWPRDAGLRLDHLLLSPALSGSLVNAGVDRDVRGWTGASDHAPAWVVLRLPAAEQSPVPAV